MTTGHSQVKVLPPRPLSSTETVHSLSQWKINFKQYCKKDESFKYFLRSTTVWDKTENNAGFTEDVGKKKTRRFERRSRRFPLNAGQLSATRLHNR